MNINEIARLTGLSNATVSRVINGYPGVSAKAREAIQTVIGQTGYTPNLVARDLKTRKSRSLGLVLPGVNSYFSPAVEAISHTLRRENAHLLITANPSGMGSPEEEAQSLQILLSKRVQGVIFFASQITDAHKKVFDTWPKDTQLVVVNEDTTSMGFPCVLQDPRHGMTELFHRLWSQGRRRWAFIDGPSSDRTVQDRQSIRGELAEELGLELATDRIVLGDFGQASGRDAALKLLDKGDFDALVCSNDFMAMGALQGLASRGVEVPRQTAVAGHDNIEASAFSIPALTTVDQDIREVGLGALELVLDRWTRPDLGVTKVVIGSRLVVRGSA